MECHKMLHPAIWWKFHQSCFRLSSQRKHFRMKENHTRSPIKMLKKADQPTHPGGFGDKVSELRNFSESAVYLLGPKRQFKSNWGMFDLFDSVPFPLAKIQVWKLRVYSCLIAFLWIFLGRWYCTKLCPFPHLCASCSVTTVLILEKK